MELINVNQENSFNPTPKLKSSPIPIFFVSFNGDDNICIHCGEKYTMTLIYEQKYCKKCLSNYLTNMDNDSSKHKTDTRSGTVIIDNINMYLDVYLLKKDLECNNKKIISINSGNNVLDDFLISIRHDQLKIAKFANDLKNIDKYFVPSKICDYSLCEGGFGIVYLATLIDGSKYLTNYDEYDTKNRDKLVILKRFKNFQYAKNYFMIENKSSLL
ncbi:kinase-like domain-containing protein [Rhizophagus irregularis DAOM 181602=DAOM 197198]|nr:kinase-like domain-containing protein [Rhizophagus irregularis DAOM 181602=DAOM 197198]